jgi:hypothetical protein
MLTHFNIYYGIEFVSTSFVHSHAAQPYHHSLDIDLDTSFLEVTLAALISLLRGLCFEALIQAMPTRTACQKLATTQTIMHRSSTRRRLSHDTLALALPSLPPVLSIARDLLFSL